MPEGLAAAVSTVSAAPNLRSRKPARKECPLLTRMSTIATIMLLRTHDGDDDGEGTPLNPGSEQEEAGDGVDDCCGGGACS